jgi:LuxR family maltose regulon positive regulatory protein
MATRARQHGSAASGIRWPVILANKVRPPAGAPAAANRPRLMPGVEDFKGTRLLLLKALAGYGKTTLLRQYKDWLEQHGLAAAWLRFDAADNEKTRAVAYLAAAFSGIDPGMEAYLAPFLAALPPLPTEDVLAALINRLERSERQVALLIDDYHTIVNDEVHDALFYFLVNMPPNVHCVVASRSQPRWTMAEIAHNGAVRMFDEAEIRFDAREIAGYLAAEHGVTLDEAGLQALSDQTRGWITAIKLAALSLEKQHSGLLTRKVISGTHRGLVEYLAQSVLERQDQETQDFLLQTAPLDRLCAPLCDAVTGADNGRVMLDKLQRENLFVEPLDAHGVWYRYHALFAEFLADRLARAPHLDRTGIHRRASCWFEVNGQPYAAADHALAAGDESRREALIEAAILDMVRASQIALAMGWFESLPEAFSATKPNVLIPMAWSHIYSRRFSKAQALLQKAELLLTRSVEKLSEQDRRVADEFRVELEMARLELTRVSTGQLAGRSRLQELKDRLRPGWDFLRAFVELEICYVNIRDDRLESAFAAAADAVVFARRVPNLFIANIAFEHQARIRYLQGRMGEAAEFCSQAIDRALDRDGDPLPVAGRIHLLAAEILYETNDLKRSRERLEQAMQLTALNESPDIRCETEILAARHAAATQGERAAAARLFEYNSRLDESAPLSFGRLRAFQAWFLTGCGDLAAAEGVLRQLPAPVDSNRPPATLVVDPLQEVRHLALCRYMIAAGKAQHAVNWLRHLLRLAERGGRLRSCVRINGLLALAQAAREQHDSALRYVRETLMLGERGGFARIIIDLGDDLMALLDAYQQRLQAAEVEGDEARLCYIRHLLGAWKGDNDAALRVASAPSRAPVPESETAELAGCERLTSRELQILQLVAQGNTNRDVASELLIAESSVRWHVRNLYTKLGVHNRTGASAKARRLKLIH